MMKKLIRKIRNNLTKKNLQALGIVLAIAIIAITFVFVIIAVRNTSGLQENSEIKGEAFINWELVNVRADYTVASECLGTLERGDTVLLTGTTYQYFWDAAYPSWVEICYNGQYAWIVRDAIETRG